MQNRRGRPQTQGPSVLIASSEVAPYAKTGGLADVMSSLPGALAGLGTRVSVIAPAYRSVLKGGYELEDTGFTFRVPVSDHEPTGSLLKTKTGDDVPVYFVRADQYYDRDYLYGTPDGDYPDNAERFVFFSRAILEVMRHDPPQILNANDWQTALAIAFLKSQPQIYPELGRVKTVMTLHNLGYQGRFWSLDWPLLNLDPSLFNWHYLEFHGMINFLKGGIVSADAITTVSPTYSQEIKKPEQGFGLEGVFQERAARLSGILNGVDYRIWDPKTDPLIARTYSLKDSSGKRLCKADLQKQFGLDLDPSVPLIGMVTRLTEQKGTDLVQSALGALVARGCQFVLVGTGDRASQEFFFSTPAQFPGRVGVEIGFNELLSHKVIAGSDFLLVPSRYEPAGLTHLYGLKYGTIPIVRSTGGLKDTVSEFHPERPEGNGFVFYLYEPRRLLAAVDRALAVFGHTEPWTKLTRNAMAADFSWTKSARKYLDTYNGLISGAT